MSLLKKVFITVTVIAILTMLALLYFGLAFMRSAVTDASSMQQLQLARQAMFALDRSLYGSYQQIRTVGNDDALVAAAANPKDANAQKQADQRMQELGKDISDWAQIAVVDLDGRTVVTAADQQTGQQSVLYPADNPAYQQIFTRAAAGEVVYSDAIRSEQTGKPTVLFASPLRDGTAADAPVVGVVFSELDWAVVQKSLQGTADVTFELFNRAGLELGDSKEDADDEILKRSRADDPAIAAALKGKEDSRLVDSVTGGGQALISYVHERSYLDYKGNGWILAVKTPASIVFAPVREFSRKLPVVFVIVVAIAVTTVMLVLDRIVLGNVNTLMRVTQDIAAGDLTARAHIRTRDEFGRLGEAYNRMADKLQEMYRELEAKVLAKTAELNERVKESEAARARDEAILAGMGEGLIALNDKGEVVLVNVLASEIFGIPRDKLYGKQLTQLLDSLRDDKDAIMPQEWRPEVRAQTTKQSVSGDYTYHRYMTDGERLALKINATPIFSNGQLVGVVLVVRDATKEKEVDRMKTEFISLASHQLRTPLSAIKWFSKMLAAGDAGQLNDEQAEFARNITDSTERMIELVNSLLNISRIESGRIIIDPKPTDLNELVGKIVRDLQPKIDEKYQHLVISVHDGLPQINLDTHLIGQVYMNLLTNAIKYTPKEGTITIIISTDDNRVITQISDTGFGIPADQQDKIFQKFFRADNVAKFETDGTGLGLYLVKAIIESSGGSIWFKSEEGKGTSFWFSLPLTGMIAQEGEVVLDEA